MDLLETLVSLEDKDELHLARLLILLKAFSGRKGDKAISGLTKLVKLDFLLRYPVYLEKALQVRNALPTEIKIMDYERKSIESSMIRYHYGPWDPRYRRFINILVAKKLVYVSIEKRTIKIGITPQGVEIASHLTSEEYFKDSTQRAQLLKRYFDFGATRLKNFIYQTFPEITSLELGEEIR